MTEKEGCRFSLRTLCIWVLGLSAAFAIIKTLGDAVQRAQRAAVSTASQGPLNQIQLALHNYHQTYDTFPPAYFADENGRPMHSWRVLLLPFLENQALYQAYDFNEPWDGPNNQRLATQMPRCFRSPSEPYSNSKTNMVVIVGPGTAFPGKDSARLADFTDGAGNTILLTEISDSDIQWLEPRDLDVETMSFQPNDREAPSISAVSWRQPYVVFADRITAYAVSPEIPADKLKALTTIAGNEPVTRRELESAGHLD